MRLGTADKNYLYCFTPLVTLLTFIFEFVAAVYVIWRYRKSRFGRFSALLLLLLSIFQLAEYLICINGHPLLWTKIGWIAITFLPIVGLELIAMITFPIPRLKKVGYGLAMAFSVAIAAAPAIFEGTTCTGYFIVFHQSALFGSLYSVYYLAFLVIGIIMLIRSLHIQKRKKLIRWFLIGYASFMIPTYLIYEFVAITRVAVPSILCGFAILLAVILVAKVLPLTEK